MFICSNHPVGTPEYIFGNVECRVQIAIFWEDEKYYGTIWCITIHSNPKLTD